MKEAISTHDAPQAIGIYSQAIKTGNTVYISGQIPLDPAKMIIVEGGIQAQIKQVLDNLNAITHAAGGNLNQIVKVTVYLTDLGNFNVVNEMMAHYFSTPYPARAVVEIKALPKGAEVEMDAIMILGQVTPVKAI
jgi:reactive intermediate/imine deaminase